jgi:hypothetical protein
VPLNLHLGRWSRRGTVPSGGASPLVRRGDTVSATVLHLFEVGELWEGLDGV